MPGQTFLPVGRLISVQVNLFLSSGQFANFSAAMIIGSTPGVIDVTSRFQQFASSTAVGLAYGNTSPEYLAAQTFFSAKPTPSFVFIGRWAATATQGQLIGGDLVGAQQNISTFNSITNGSMKISVNGNTAQEVDNLNFSAAGNLNQVATILTTAMTNASIAATCTWTGSEFVISTLLTGNGASVSFTQSPSSGTDITNAFGLSAALGAYLAPGINAESALTAAQTIDAMQYFYWLMFASPSIQTSDHIAIAEWVESASNAHMYGLTSSDPNALNPLSTADVGYQLNQLGLTRTFGQWSSLNPYAVAGIIGIGCGINWLGSNTAINFMYQPEPGVLVENLNVNQASSLDSKKYNYVAAYANGSSVLENGTCFGIDYIDERVGADWFANYVQTKLFNFLAGIGTKVSQTDAGVHSMVNNVTSSCGQAINNGLGAPGVWTAAGFGQLNEGDTLTLGYYVYAPPIATQDSTSRNNRISPPIQVALKLAGAINKANVILNISR